MAGVVVAADLASGPTSRRIVLLLCSLDGEEHGLRTDDDSVLPRILFDKFDVVHISDDHLHRGERRLELAGFVFVTYEGRDLEVGPPLEKLLNQVAADVPGGSDPGIMDVSEDILERREGEYKKTLSMSTILLVRAGRTWGENLDDGVHIMLSQEREHVSLLLIHHRCIELS